LLPPTAWNGEAVLVAGVLAFVLAGAWAGWIPFDYGNP
jgi:hypothetical protein